MSFFYIHIIYWTGENPNDKIIVIFLLGEKSGNQNGKYIKKLQEC